jgi:sec-independent protein translocase protein TatB
VFENLNWWEILFLLLLAMFIFGPDRLPKAISEGVRILRSLRQMANNATGEINRQLGTNLEAEDLHPKTFLRKHLLSEEDEQALRQPLENLYSDVRGQVTGLRGEVDQVRSDLENTRPRTAPAPQRRQEHGYDTDAT